MKCTISVRDVLTICDVDLPALLILWAVAMVCLDESVASLPERYLNAAALDSCDEDLSGFDVPPDLMHNSRSACSDLSMESKDSQLSEFEVAAVCMFSVTFSVDSTSFLTKLDLGKSLSSTDM